MEKILIGREKEQVALLKALESSEAEMVAVIGLHYALQYFWQKAERPFVPIDR